MRYLLLAYQRGSVLEALPAGERDALEKTCADDEEVLRGSGQLLAAQRFQQGHPVTSLRVRRGRVSVSDGPFVQTEQQLVGAYIISARDLNDAIRLAAKLPPAHVGCVEIRQIGDLDAL
jgi:hypothetical protein